MRMYLYSIWIFTVFASMILCTTSQSDNTSGKPVQYRLRQIMMQPEISPEHDAKLKKQSEAILKRARKGGDFTALAKLFSQEPGAGKTGGDLGFFTRDQMVKSFSDAVFSMKPGEIQSDYELNTGKVIVRRFSDLDPIEVPAVLVANHGPFSWGKNPAEALEANVVLEEVAKMALGTITINPDQGPISRDLLDKHYLRKHGENAYYGQQKPKNE